MKNRHKLHRPRRIASGAAVVSCATLAILGPPGAAFSEDSNATADAAPAAVADFNLTAVAGVVNFTVHYPDLFLPFIISGGILEARSYSSGVGQAEGVAGAMPVPLTNSGGLLNPTNVPGTDFAVPGEVRKGYESIDFTRFPNSCISRYPEVREGDREGYCGGSALGDEGAGATVAIANGHTTSTGDRTDPLQSRANSVSRAAEATIPGLQTAIRNGWAKTSTGLNVQDGVPESTAETQADELSLLGGFVRFTGVRSEALVRTDGTDSGTSVNTKFSFREASVFGIPVTIGPDGVTVREEKLGAGQSPRDAATKLGEAFKANGVEIRFVPAPPPSHEGGQINVQSAGVEIIHRDASVTPADSVYRIGFAAARGNAVPQVGGSDVVGAGGSTGSDALLPSGSSSSETGAADAGASGTSVEPAFAGGDVLADTAFGSSDESVSGGQGGGTAFSSGFGATGPGADAGSGRSGAASSPGTDVAAIATSPSQGVQQAQAAASVAVQPLSYNNLTRTAGGILGLAIVVGAGVPLRRMLVRRP